MPKSDFILNIGLTGSMLDGPRSEQISLDLACFTPVVKPGDTVLAGDLVAKAKVSGQGDLHSPLAGEVVEISGLSEFSMIIRAKGEGSVEPRDLSQTTGAELKTILAELGIDTTRMPSAKTLIINAMPPEPGILVQEQLLRDYRPFVARGLTAAKSVITPSQVILAGVGVDASAFGSCAVRLLAPVYPNGLDPLVIKAVTGEENPPDFAILSVLELFLIGQAMETGLPCTQTVVTVGDKNVHAMIGTPLKALLDMSNITATERDRVIIGGPLRGETAISLEAGISKDSLAVQVIPHGAFPPVEDNPCLNCGECVLVCPSRILPNMISRTAEFRLYDRARQYGVDACMECGLCGYHCTGRRPLLQYIRLAKKELAAMDLTENPVEKAEAPKCC
ncbi:MAG: 4Fe-4S dicluster domain-containing protein [Proteobacteria bacterium]|nr:4Fe-4S dicluster domain-containing protein [Pseudomonadota bacterium]